MTTEAEGWRVPKSVIHFAERYAERLECGDETRKQPLHRFLMLLRNGSPKAIQACEMYDRGEISGVEMLEMVN